MIWFWWNWWQEYLVPHMVLLLLSKLCVAYNPQNGEDSIHLLSIVQSLTCNFLPPMREILYVFWLKSICFSYLNMCNSSIIRGNFYMFTYVNFNAILHVPIFPKKFRIIFRLCEPIRMMILGHTKSKTKWVHILSPTSLLSFNDIHIKASIYFFIGSSIFHFSS